MEVVDLDLAQQVRRVVVAVDADLRQPHGAQRLDPREVEVAEADDRLHAHPLRHQRRVHGRRLVGESEHAHARNTAHVSARNVLGGPLETCGSDPVTGFFRDGCCNTDERDVGSHTICAVVTAEFLEHQQAIGNDLATPRPEFAFPGLEPGDRWCVTAVNWLRAYQDGAAAFVVLASTHERALDIVPLAALQELAVDVPADPGPLNQ